MTAHTPPSTALPARSRGRTRRAVAAVPVLLTIAALLVSSPACHAQRGGRARGADPAAIQARVRSLVESIEARRNAGYDVTAAEALLDDLRAALAHKDRAEAKRLGDEIRRRLATAPLATGGIPAPPAELWTALPAGDVPERWRTTDARFGLLDCYMNASLPVAQSWVKGSRAQWVRISAPLSGGLNWGSVERDRGRYAWGKPDSVIAQIRAARVEPMITFGITNPWDAEACGRTRATYRQLPCDLAAYERFVRASVERYKRTVRVWQVWNEPDDTGHWADTPERYADLVVATARAVKAADPGARVVLAGVYKREFLAPVVQRLSALSPKAPVVDAFDIHFFGVVRNAGVELQNLHKTYRDLGGAVDMVRTVTAGTPYAATPVWATETATYTDAPAQMWPAQTERDQARDLVRRFCFAFGLGVKRVAWASLVEWTTWTGKEANFNHAGLVRNPAHGHGSGPKLSYFAYQHLVSRLGDFTAVSRLPAPDWVTALRFTTARGPVIVAWYDRWAATCPATITARLPVSSASTVTVERAIPASAPSRATATATFGRSTLPVRDRAITLTLDDDPVFVLPGR